MPVSFVSLIKFLFKNLKDIFPQRIWQQILIILISLVVIPLILLCFLLINTSQHAIKTSVLRDHKEIAIRATGEVEKFLVGPEKALRVTSAILGTLHADDWKKETTLVELALQYPIFRKVAYVNLEGQEVVSSTLGLPLEDRSQDPAFKETKSAEFYRSEVYIADDYIPVMKWSVPLKELGVRNGVLIAEVSLRGVWDIVDSIQIGKTGRAYLIDSNGYVLSHPDKKLILENKNFLYRGVVSDVLSGKVGSREENGENGESWIVAFAPIQSMGWGLIIFQDQKESYAFLDTMKTEAKILLILSILASVFISTGLSRLMSHPVHLLIRGTQRIGQGNFDEPVKVERMDEMGRLIQSFNDMMGTLKQARRLEKLSVIGQAATAIAHELKNSLTLVNTFMQILPERSEDKEFIADFSKVVPQELNSWKSMLQEMMDFSRLDRLQKFSKDLMDLNPLLYDIVSSFKERSKQDHIQIHTEIVKNPALIKGNSDKLKQVLLNLLTNAFEATPKGGVITLKTALVPADVPESKSYILIEVKDTGSGIPSEEVSKIFEPFHTTKTNGLGLGLAICHEIISYHDGDIEVASEAGQGTIFSIHIPTVES